MRTPRLQWLSTIKDILERACTKAGTLAGSYLPSGRIEDVLSFFLHVVFYIMMKWKRRKQDNQKKLFEKCQFKSGFPTWSP